MEELKASGNDNFRAQRFEAAIDDYERALECVGPQDQRVFLWSNLANAEFALGRWKQAVQRASDAIQADTGWLKAYWRKAQALEKLGESQLAALEYVNGLNACKRIVSDSQQKLFVSNLDRVESSLEWTRLSADWVDAVNTGNGEKISSLVPLFQQIVDPMLEYLRRPSDFPFLSKAPALGEMALFLGFCFSDLSVSAPNERAKNINITLAKHYLDAAIQADAPFHAFVELALILEKENDFQGAMALAARPKSPWLNVWQRPGFLHPGCESQAFWDANRFPWVSELERHAQAIRLELEGILLGKNWVRVGDRHQGDASVLTKGQWKEIALFGRGSEAGVAPVTQGIIRRIAPHVLHLCDVGGGEVTFSRLGPKAHITAHCAPSNHRLTAHLGLVLPTSTNEGTTCRIRVGPEWRCWEQGKVLVFDDSFEHEVVNETNQERVVLLLRFPHPAFCEEPHITTGDGDLVAAYRQVEDVVEKAAKSRNELWFLRSVPPCFGESKKAAARAVWSKWQSMS